MEAICQLLGIIVGSVLWLIFFTFKILWLIVSGLFRLVFRRETEPEESFQEPELSETDKLFARMNYCRQMIDVVDDESLRKKYIRARREANGEIIDYQEENNVRLIPSKSVDEILEPVRKARKMGLILATHHAEKVKVGQTIRVLRGMRASVGVVVDVENNIVRYKTLKGEKTARLDDGDLSIVWINPK